MLGVSQAALLGAASAALTYDDLVDLFDPAPPLDPHVVSYWKFQNNGADRKGTQSASITGSPELNVDTIVDLDTVADGAAADGKCIAWPGSSGVFAEAAHNAAHKTAEGAIVVTFQRDTASQKSVLLAADRSDGGTSSGPGGLSVEVNADGSPRAFLRRQSDGAPVILVGQAGDVQLNEAYTLIFKWGSAGLSLALWAESGTLVRRLTDPLGDGVTGVSPIRFGAWHTDFSHHDGPYGRVIWLNRRISDGEEEVLARARTVARADTPRVETFPFITTSNPTVDHTGVTSRPAYNASNPLAAAVIDPMSGITIVRVGGNAGSTLFINGNQDSGLVFPQRLRNENSPSMNKVWNADGTLLMIDRYFSRTGDAANSAQSYLIDVDGSHGSGGPWRILRASSSSGLGDGGGQWWMWDLDNPLRAYIIRANGSIDEWWPIGGDGHAVGEVNNLYGPPSGVNSFTSGQRHMLHTSRDGQFYVAGCRQASTGHWGGQRRNLWTGAVESFFPHPGPPLGGNDGTWQSHGISINGQFMVYNVGGDRQIVRNAVTGTIVADTLDIDSEGIAHYDWAQVNGVEYLIGQRGTTSGFRGLNLNTETYVQWGTFPGNNPQHTCARNTEDRFEIYGAAGGGTSGARYAIWVRSEPSGGPRAILGVRLGPNDQNQIRYLANHRSVRTSNSDECHVQVDPNGRYVSFNSNWRDADSNLNDHVHPYVILLPAAWHNPNNDGS